MSEPKIIAFLEHRMACFHLDPRVVKCLELLRRSGKKASLAATKVEEIIARLQAGGNIPDRVGTVTKHGEARIKGVVKYDLGSGYRLVTYKQVDRLFLLYAGTHDDCHRWIGNNRELTVEQIKERCIMIPVHGPRSIVFNNMASEHAQENFSDAFSEISEKDLRRVFVGLSEPSTR
jgi:hypothetical protein